MLAEIGFHAFGLFWLSEVLAASDIFFVMTLRVFFGHGTEVQYSSVKNAFLLAAIS